jgi:hypothetical protein
MFARALGCALGDADSRRALLFEGSLRGWFEFDGTSLKAALSFPLQRGHPFRQLCEHVALPRGMMLRRLPELFPLRPGPPVAAGRVRVVSFWHPCYANRWGWRGGAGFDLVDFHSKP